MKLVRLFNRINRNHWFVCYTCLGDTGHNEVQSIFHSLDPKELVLGRPLQRCPRCGGTNTKSFAELKAEEQDSAVWGLECTVKKHSRRLFEVRRST